MKLRACGGLSIIAVTALGGGAGYLMSDRSNLLRSDISLDDLGPDTNGVTLHRDETQILRLASLAPSGHNAQPWFVTHVEPFHWILCNDSTRWLPAVDPLQRETMLSLGAFAHSLEQAAGAIGYASQITPLASSNQDERVLEVRLIPTASTASSVIEQIENRRTVRTPLSKEPLQSQDLAHLLRDEADHIHYLPATGKQGQSISAMTIEANRLQTDRDSAQQELANWIRFSSAEARQHRDGLTTAALEIEGFAGWAVRNFYNKQSVMKKSFREQGLTKVRESIAGMAGWILITSPDASTRALLDTGKRLQRMWIKLRERNIAIHPMTQVLEEPSTLAALETSLGIAGPVQFILRTGYVADSRNPVSLRRPVSWFTRPLGRA